MIGCLGQCDVVQTEQIASLLLCRSQRQLQCFFTLLQLMLFFLAMAVVSLLVKSISRQDR